MKRYINITILLLYFVGGHTFAQNKIKGYKYWFDNDYSSGVTTTVTPAEYFDLNTAIPTTGLNTGIHTFNILFWDDSLEYSSPLSRFFFIKTEQMVVNKDITAWQYWFDDDFENAITQNITQNQLYNLSESLNVNNLNSGVHIVNVRFKDNTNTWSSTISQFFFKRPEQTVVNEEIVAWQFWMDNDFENATTQMISPTQQFSLMENLEVNYLNPGIHKINIRFKDNTHTWSSTISQFFFIRPETTLVNKEIVAWQYWIDGEYEVAVTQNITPAQQFILVDNLDLNDLNSGIHALNFRFKDNSGDWSTTLSQFFLKKETATIFDNEIIAYRYWFDEDFESMMEAQFNPTGSGVNLLSDIDMTQLWKGEHAIHFKFYDSHNQWSVITSDSVTKNSLPIADFDYTADLYCDSTVISFSNFSIDGDEYLWDFGNGNVSEEFEPVFTYFEAGDYSVSLTVTDTILGIDSTVVEIIGIISNVTYATINPVECDSYTSPGGNYTWTISGSYLDTIPNFMGCDSVITVELTILNSTFNTITETACEYYISPSGNYTWTTSGNYMDTIPNNAGCDSVITVDLTIHYNTLANLTETACFNYTSPSGNYTWTTSGIYMDTISTAMGCDSIISIDLTINTVDTTVSIEDNMLTANALDATYQWLNCEGMSPIPGETNQSFMPDETGSYAVEVTQNDCIDTSSCYQVVISGFDEISFGPDFTIYPNPTTGFFTIDLGQEYKGLTVKVLDYKGELVKTTHYNSTEKLKLDLEGAKGLYFIDIKTAEGKSTIIKVIKE